MVVFGLTGVDMLTCCLFYDAGCVFSPIPHLLQSTFSRTCVVSSVIRDI